MTQLIGNLDGVFALVRGDSFFAVQKKDLLHP